MELIFQYTDTHYQVGVRQVCSRCSESERRAKIYREYPHFVILPIKYATAEDEDNFTYRHGHAAGSDDQNRLDPPWLPAKIKKPHDNIDVICQQQQVYDRSSVRLSRPRAVFGVFW